MDNVVALRPEPHNPADEFLADWLLTLRTLGRKPATLESYQFAFQRLVRWHESTLSSGDVLAMTRAQARQYLAYCLDTASPKSAETWQRALRAGWNHAIAEGWIDGDNIWTGQRISVPESEQPTPSEEQIDKLIKNAGARSNPNRLRDVAIVLALCDTGARKGEVASIRLMDADLDNGLLHFPESKTRPRTVPMSNRLHLAMARWLRCRGVGQPSSSIWSVSSPYDLLRHVVRRHSRGIDGVITPHSLRRSWVVRALKAGMPPAAIARAAGWTNGGAQMIALYANARIDEVVVESMKTWLNE